jgi:Fic family protein
MSKKDEKINIAETGWRPDGPHNLLPKLPPFVQLETHAVLKQCITARAALGELKQAANLIPNQAMLINTLPKLEARASSEIENIVTTEDKLFQHSENLESADPATKEALRYSRALFEGFEVLKREPLTTRTAERLCTIIKGVDMRVRKLPGTALGNQATGEVIYTPPVGEALLRDLLQNWETFMHEQSALDPLIRMAAGHYQFEAIHPFTDGNGRTGRILNSLFLIEEGLLDLPILYLSRYFLKTRQEYYKRLIEVTETGSWEGWLIYVIKGVEETALWTIAKIEAMRLLEQTTAEHVRRKLPKIYSHELIALLFNLPYCRIGDLVEQGLSKRQTASLYLGQLAAIGVLNAMDAGRQKLFLNTRLLDLLSKDNNAFDPYTDG